MEYQSSTTGKSSLFRVIVEPGSCVFRYEVRIITTASNGKEFYLTKQTDQTKRSEDNKACRQAVRLALTEAGTDIGDGDYAYDGKALLYSRRSFDKVEVNLSPRGIRKNEVLNRYLVDEDAIRVEIIPGAGSPTIDYSIFSDAVAQGTTFAADATVQQFLELVTSEALISVAGFHSARGGLLLKTEPTRGAAHSGPPRTGMHCLEGIKKGVRIIDDKTAWLVVDMKTSYVYGGLNETDEALSLADVYKHILRENRNNVPRANRAFTELHKGVRLWLSYRPSRTILFHTLSKFASSAKEYAIGDKTVPEFFLNKYQVDLANPEFPGAQTSFGMKKNEVFPLQCLYVFPGQLVSPDKDTFEPRSCVKPHVRYDYIMRTIKLLSAGEGAKFLSNFGIRIVQSSNDVTINCLALPKIRVRDGRSNKEKLITPSPIDGNFFKDVTNASFIYTPNLITNDWVVVHDRQASGYSVKEFIGKLVAAAQASGFKLKEPHKYHEIADLKYLEKVFIDARSLNQKGDGPKTNFIMYIDRKEKDSHGLLKLFEANYKIISQHVTFNVASECLSGRYQTLKNIAMKFNSKCLGLNFLPVFEECMADLDLEKNKDLLVIGIDVSHPAPASPYEFKTLNDKGYKDLSSLNPSIVGICANKTEHLAAFSGDFYYQESRRECLSAPLLQKAVQQIVECTYSKSRRKPTRIVVFRDGISGGQYRMVVEQELPAIRSGYKLGIQSVNQYVKELKLGEPLDYVEPKITLVIATKRHSKRFFRIDEKGKIQNTRPGDVIGSGVDARGDDVSPKMTRQDIPESFVQTHHALRGTPQITQYVVLCNELELPVLKIQKFVLLLANMHQVTGCPTSLPLPVYMAQETCKRGSAVYTEYKRQKKMHQDKQPTFFKKLQVESKPLLIEQFDELTGVFGYAYSNLVGTRFNA